MRPRGARYILALSVVLWSLAGWDQAHGPIGGAAAQTIEVASCPEPNDGFQTSCFVGDEGVVYGIISSADDIDGYRFETLDFGAHVMIALTETPAPYRLHLTDWNGDIIATSKPGPGGPTIDATLGPPGSYYLFVDSRTGEFHAEQPYRLVRLLTYPGGQPPERLFSTEFRQGTSDAFVGSNASAEYVQDGARYTVWLKRGAEPGKSYGAWTLFGPDVSDFSLTVDSRIVTDAANPAEVGYTIQFRSPGQVIDSFYLVKVNGQGQIKLAKRVHGEETDVVGWVTGSPPVRGSAVNRTVVRCVGSTIRVSLNGHHVISASDPTFTSGRFGLGAITWGSGPVAVHFDNVLVTTPGR